MKSEFNDVSARAVKRRKLCLGFFFRGECGEVFLSREAPEDEEKCSEGNSEYHAKKTAKGGAPKENGKDDEHWAHTCFIAHDAWGEDIIGQKLSDDKNEGAECNELRAAAFLEVSDGEDGDDAEHSAKVGNDIEKTERKSDRDAKFKANEPKADR